MPCDVLPGGVLVSLLALSGAETAVSKGRAKGSSSELMALGCRCCSSCFFLLSLSLLTLFLVLAGVWFSHRRTLPMSAVSGPVSFLGRLDDIISNGFVQRNAYICLRAWILQLRPVLKAERQINVLAN